jgi:hypothetical protein
MDATATHPILNLINEWGKVIAQTLIGTGLLTFVYLTAKLLYTKDHKAKYDFINRYEIRLMHTGFVLLIAGAAVMVNTHFPTNNFLGFGVRAFITITMALILEVFVSSFLKYYYPFMINKRLERLRAIPRISPKTHKPMKLISEPRKNVYLDEEIAQDEDIFSVDYDVWVDEESGYMKVEKYSGQLHTLQCSACNYQTLKVQKEEVVVAPTLKQNGSLIKFYECSYCHNETQRVFSIAQLRHNYRDNSKGAISI